jgi:hypothetical protein
MATHTQAQSRQLTLIFFHYRELDQLPLVIERFWSLHELLMSNSLQRLCEQHRRWRISNGSLKLLCF